MTLADLPAPGALLFDLDGTLVDTVGRRVEAWLAAFAEAGITADADRIGGLIGADGKRLAREVAAAAGATRSEPRSRSSTAGRAPSSPSSTSSRGRCRVPASCSRTRSTPLRWPSPRRAWATR